MYNVKAAVSRLAFAPSPEEMEVTDIATGHFVFRPLAGEEVSFAALDKAIRDAGYEIENAAIELAGTLTENRHLEAPGGQLFHLVADDEALQGRLSALEVGTPLVVKGGWKAIEGSEVVVVTEIGGGAGGGDE